MYSERVIEEGNELMEWCREGAKRARKDIKHLNIAAYAVASSLVEHMMENHEEGSERYNYLKELLNYLDTLV